MIDAETPDGFRTLRGAISGDEPDEPSSFTFCATLRIHGEAVPFSEIEQALGVAATHTHRKGDRRGPRSPEYRDDAWHYSPPVDESAALACHIEALWAVVAPAVEFLKGLKARYKVDVFCGYRSNRDTAGFEVPHTCLKLFTALEIPFEVSVIVC
jgi:hypothetical protein